MITKEQLLIRPKIIIEDSLRFKIPTGLSELQSELQDNYYCTWKELINAEGPLPTDIFSGISWDEDESDLDGNDVLVVVVKRKREETDEEYNARMEEIIEYRKSYEDGEKHDYERLKAKYMTEDQEKIEYERLRAKFDPV